MESETPWWISLIVSWLPFLVLIGVWVFLSKRMQIGGPGGHKLLDLYEAQVAETKKMNLALERIAAALEKRS
jgi:ATP-dependent Zn protease